MIKTINEINMADLHELLEEMKNVGMKFDNITVDDIMKYNVSKISIDGNTYTNTITSGIHAGKEIKTMYNEGGDIISIEADGIDMTSSISTIDEEKTYSDLTQYNKYKARQEEIIGVTKKHVSVDISDADENIIASIYNNEDIYPDTNEGTISRNDIGYNQKSVKSVDGDTTIVESYINDKLYNSTIIIESDNNSQTVINRNVDGDMEYKMQTETYETTSIYRYGMIIFEEIIYNEGDIISQQVIYDIGQRPVAVIVMKQDMEVLYISGGFDSGYYARIEIDEYEYNINKMVSPRCEMNIIADGDPYTITLNNLSYNDIIPEFDYGYDEDMLEILESTNITPISGLDIDEFEFELDEYGRVILLRNISNPNVFEFIYSDNESSDPLKWSCINTGNSELINMVGESNYSHRSINGVDMITITDSENSSSTIYVDGKRTHSLTSYNTSGDGSISITNNIIGELTIPVGNGVLSYKGIEDTLVLGNIFGEYNVYSNMAWTPHSTNYDTEYYYITIVTDMSGSIDRFVAASKDEPGNRIEIVFDRNLCIDIAHAITKDGLLIYDTSAEEKIVYRENTNG